MECKLTLNRVDKIVNPITIVKGNAYNTLVLSPKIIFMNVDLT